jgi:hypothetical protein
MVPSDPDDRLLTRSELAEALTKRGYPTPSATLATMASRGGGPKYVLYGRLAMYRWSDALAWVQTRLSEPKHATAPSQNRVFASGAR